MRMRRRIPCNYRSSSIRRGSSLRALVLVLGLPSLEATWRGDKDQRKENLEKNWLLGSRESRVEVEDGRRGAARGGERRNGEDDLRWNCSGRLWTSHDPMSLHATVVAGCLLVRGWLAGSDGRHLGHTSWRRAVLVVLA